MSTPFRLQVPQPIYDEMIAQAVAELPNECCGLLAGRIIAPGNSITSSSLPVAQVERRYPLINQLASPTEFLSDDRDLFEAHRDMRRLGLEVLAVYHSHPASEPVPSRKDLERYYWNDAVCVIISLKHREPKVCGWWLTDKDYREADVAIGR